MDQQPFVLPPLGFGAQISLSNPLTIPVSFRLETCGPFAINPTPSKKRLHNGKKTAQRCFSGADGGAKCPDGNQHSHHRGAPEGGGSSPKCRRAAATRDRAVEDSGAADAVAAGVPKPATRRPAKHQQQGQEVVLLPGRNLQLELVFMPSRSPEMSESLVSSFSPGREVCMCIPLACNGYPPQLFAQ